MLISFPNMRKFGAIFVFAFFYFVGFFVPSGYAVSTDLKVTSAWREVTDMNTKKIISKLTAEASPQSIYIDTVCHSDF